MITECARHFRSVKFFCIIEHNAGRMSWFFFSLMWKHNIKRELLLVREGVHMLCHALVFKSEFSSLFRMVIPYQTSCEVPVRGMSVTCHSCNAFGGFISPWTINEKLVAILDSLGVLCHLRTKMMTFAFLYLLPRRMSKHVYPMVSMTSSRHRAFLYLTIDGKFMLLQENINPNYHWEPHKLETESLYRDSPKVFVKSLKLRSF